MGLHHHLWYPGQTKVSHGFVASMFVIRGVRFPWDFPLYNLLLLINLVSRPSCPVFGHLQYTKMGRNSPFGHLQYTKWRRRPAWVVVNVYLRRGWIAQLRELCSAFRMYTCTYSLSGKKKQAMLQDRYHSGPSTSCGQTLHPLRRPWHNSHDTFWTKWALHPMVTMVTMHMVKTNKTILQDKLTCGTSRNNCTVWSIQRPIHCFVQYQQCV